MVFLPSIDEIKQEEIEFYNAHHFKELLNLSSGVWISRGSGQESLISLRSPVLTGAGACGSFQILEDGIQSGRQAFAMSITYLRLLEIWPLN